jgi:hypothetical protein
LTEWRAFTCSVFVPEAAALGGPDFPGRGSVTGVIEKFTNFLANWRDAIVGPE